MYCQLDTQTRYRQFKVQKLFQSTQNSPSRTMEQVVERIKIVVSFARVTQNYFSDHI